MTWCLNSIKFQSSLTTVQTWSLTRNHMLWLSVTALTSKIWLFLRDNTIKHQLFMKWVLILTQRTCLPSSKTCILSSKVQYTLVMQVDEMHSQEKHEQLNSTAIQIQGKHTGAWHVSHDVSWVSLTAKVKGRHFLRNSINAETGSQEQIRGAWQHLKNSIQESTKDLHLKPWWVLQQLCGSKIIISQTGHLQMSKLDIWRVSTFWSSR